MEYSSIPWILTPQAGGIVCAKAYNDVRKQTPETPYSLLLQMPTDASI